MIFIDRCTAEISVSVTTSHRPQVGQHEHDDRFPLTQGVSRQEKYMTGCCQGKVPLYIDDEMDRERDMDIE